MSMPIVSPLNRRNLLLGGAAVLCIVKVAPLIGQVPDSGPLARLAAMTHPAETQVLVVTDRGNSRWRRTAQRPAVSSKLFFRSADRLKPDGSFDTAEGGWWIIDEPALRAAHAGALRGDRSDASAEIQAVLDAAALLQRPLDDLHTPYRVDHPVTLPAGVVWNGANLQAGTPGMVVVLISSGSRLLDFDIRGTGTISPRAGGPSQVDERAVYPAIDGLRDAVIAGRISNITVGVHLQPLTPDGPPPSSCQINVEITDVVGHAGASEGYGVLLSPAERCSVRVKATNIQRHAVYLSAGASHNVVEADVTNCFQDAVTIYSLATQPACTGNRLNVSARGIRVPVGEPEGSMACCFSIFGKAVDNTAHVIAAATAEADGPAAYAAALVRGLEAPDGPFPENNRLRVDATGVFSGPYAVLSTDAVGTIVEGGRLSGHGSVGVIGFTDTRSNQRHFELAGRVQEVIIDALDFQVPGVVAATERAAVEIGPNVRFVRVKSPTRDYTGRLRA